MCRFPALSGHADMSAICPLSGAKRTSHAQEHAAGVVLKNHTRS
jgi:hypothetical protein